MIPFKDDNPTHIFPFVTIAIIVLNTIVLLMQITSPYGQQKIVFSYGAIPNFLLTFDTYQPIHPLLTVFTSMFMHGGILHLGGNMLYLWIFGNNIEDKLGHFRFIIFYILCGVIAAYSHALADPAYLLLFPHARIHTLVFFGFFVDVIRLPSILVIGFWIVLQFINGMISKGFAGQGGVAWFAHIGGFLAGFLLIKLFLKIKKNRYN
jgi:membrane associated rhomboid family serine protease